MELFTLGVTHAITGAKNYSEDDVAQLAKALHRLVHRRQEPGQRQGAVHSGRWFNGPKSSSASSATTTPTRRRPGARAGRPRAVPRQEAVGRVHAHAALDARCSQQLVDRVHRERAQAQAARCAAILTHPQLFESIDEPNMIKPPGRLRDRRPARARRSASRRPAPADYLDSMGQLPYFPPTVAGWEGGLSWLNTNTALARFGFVADVIGNAPNGSPAKVVDVPNETPAAAFDRAYGAVGSPWMAPARAPPSRTTPAAPPPRPARTASAARSCCARSCSQAPTHR